MCRSKYFEQLRNIEIINSTTRSHLVGYFDTIWKLNCFEFLIMFLCCAVSMLCSFYVVLFLLFVTWLLTPLLNKNQIIIVIIIIIIVIFVTTFMHGIYNHIPAKNMFLRYIFLQPYCGYNLWYMQYYLPHYYHFYHYVVFVIKPHTLYNIKYIILVLFSVQVFALF